ncbi:MAG TPA: sensor histidine kinase, partial [Rudaea sp.]
VEWDRARLEQLLTNLIVNAFKYGSPDTPVALIGGEEGSDVVLKVHNSGNAIAPEMLDRIFDPLSRGDGSGDADRSLGLGLYIVREIAKGHGGTVTVESGEAVGTTFVVRLPRAVAAADQNAAQENRTS